MKTHYYVVEIVKINKDSSFPFLTPFKVYHEYTLSSNEAKLLFSFLVNTCSPNKSKFININKFRLININEDKENHILFAYDNGLGTVIRIYSIATEHKILYIFNNIKQFGEYYDSKYKFQSAKFFFNLKDVKKEVLKYANIYYQKQQESIKNGDKLTIRPVIIGSPEVLINSMKFSGYGLNVSYDVKDLNKVHNNIEKPYY